MHELHLEESPGAVEVWVVELDQPVEIVRCVDGPSIRKAVDRLRRKYDIEDDDDVVPFADDTEALEALQSLHQKTQRMKKRRLEKQARRQAEKQAFRDWLDRTRI